ncbi:DUF4403 family protein [Sphingomonas sp. AP4-R1]|uniref:DUF4403 family protein n=1 Tax=Sphingomonas sp. AP4-R1 TaxID=2735134 RepID=UPI0020A3E4D5|nr:DUF4403 family protein [Sphingomonas sp. AP4-R1]
MLLIGQIVLSACQPVRHEAPIRAVDAIPSSLQETIIAVPIRAKLDRLGLALNRAIPRRLWAIDKADQLCVPAKRVKLVFAHVKTPDVTCRIVGNVTRGTITVSGAGQDLIVSIPMHATISAKDVGGILKQETAQADARVHIRLRLDLADDWTPSAAASIAYDWVDPPHVRFLGHRIEFTSKADDKLKGVIAALKRTLPNELARLHTKERAAQAWRKAFTSIQLNESNPPVWMQITPHALSYGGYTITRGELTLNLGMRAATKTIVGPRPSDPPATPLPRLHRARERASRVLFTIPVIADYGELEPVLARALAKRARRPFEVPGIGPVYATFGKVVIYGTLGGRIAVGLTFSAARPGVRSSHGTIWLTARPINEMNSRHVEFSELEISGITDSTGAGLLIKLANTPGLSATIADALAQNFSRDYDRLLDKVGRAMAEKRVGDIVIRAHIVDMRTGQIQAVGRGVYLPVWGRGTASIALLPR